MIWAGSQVQFGWGFGGVTNFSSSSGQGVHLSHAILKEPHRSIVNAQEGLRSALSSRLVLWNTHRRRSINGHGLIERKGLVLAWCYERDIACKFHTPSREINSSAIIRIFGRILTCK